MNGLCHKLVIFAFYLENEKARDMIISKIRYSFVAILMFFMASCSSKTAKTSELDSEARQRGIIAAKALIETKRTDVIKLDATILDAKAIESEYILKGDTLAANAFDEAFRQYVEANDSILAKELF